MQHAPAKPSDNLHTQLHTLQLRVGGRARAKPLRPADIAWLPPAYKGVMAEAWATDPAERPSAARLVTVLEALAAWYAPPPQAG